MIYYFVYILSWGIGLLTYLFGIENNLVTALLIGHLCFGISTFGVINFIGHSLLSEKIADSIGWISNGFQKELGLVSLGIGMCGVLSFWLRGSFWIATAIPYSVFLIGAGGLHIKEIVKKRNYNVGNVWIILPDFLMPLTTLILLFLAFHDSL